MSPFEKFVVKYVFFNFFKTSNFIKKQTLKHLLNISLKVLVTHLLILVCFYVRDSTIILLVFSKFKIGNWEQGWSQVTFLNMETPTNQC